MTMIREPVLEREWLEHLNDQAMHLWCGEPLVDSSQRELLLAQLVEVDVTLQRLSLRAIRDPLEAVDRQAMGACAERLDQLRRHWHPAGATRTRRGD